MSGYTGGQFHYVTVLYIDIVYKEGRITNFAYNNYGGHTKDKNFEQWREQGACILPQGA